MAAGKFEQKLSEFPLLFARSVVFGQPPMNGTATLVDFGTGPIAVTCAHVVGEYRTLRDSGRRLPFQIGNVTLDPITQLIAEDPYLDLATIRLSQEQAAALSEDGLAGGSIFQPRAWPPPPVIAGDIVALGGFPGPWRERLAFDALELRGFGIGATSVSSVSEDHFACRFERDRWKWSFRLDGLNDLQELGGMSGGPAFHDRGLHFDLVGIICQFSPGLDVMRLRPAHLIQADGSIHGMF
jgi:hypothetical protein